MNKRICIIYTGGTIGMQKTAQGYQPVAGLLEEKMASISALQDPEMPNYDLHTLDKIIDSSDMDFNAWNLIAEKIEKHYQKYDGFIVLHGTDTMAFSAAALSFMLRNLAKPVIFTGSQVPLTEVRNDGRENLVNALYIASHYQIPEVCLCFNNRLFRGNRTKKISSVKFGAFDSPNFPSLGKVATEIDIRNDLLLSLPSTKLSVQKLSDVNIAWQPLFPGLHMSYLKNLLAQSPQALVLSSFGAGNPPGNNSEFWSLIETAIKNNIIIINQTQCINGGVIQ
ncbi:MAG: asparaginase domain-containing protein, partial [Gammaproteobacteria bacterium]|nr:asparaginase domain-containing protein [Gammaproteobacteria bacterium]